MTDEPPTDDEPTVESLSDPETLRDRDDVAFRDEETVLGPGEYEDVRERVERVAGLVLAGVVDDEGRTLLVNREGCSRGWMLPGSVVAPGDDWAAAGRRAVERMTGVTVAVHGPAAVRRTVYRPAEGEAVAESQSTASPDGKHPVSNDVVWRASPTGGGTLPDAPVVDGDEWDAGWFDDLPQDVDAADEDDVRLFVD